MRTVALKLLFNLPLVFSKFVIEDDANRTLFEALRLAKLARTEFDSLDMTGLAKCTKSATKCCIWFFRQSHKRLKFEEFSDNQVFAANATFQSGSGLEFYCCKSYDTIGLYCSGMHRMYCPAGTYPRLEDIQIKEIHAHRTLEPVQTTTGFCTKRKGIQTMIVQADKTGCLDVPTIVPDSTLGDVYVYGWFTTNEPKGRTLESVWAELVEKVTGQVLYHNDEDWELTWGPLTGNVEYQVCIRAPDDLDMILHLRLGGPNEDH